MYLLRRLYLKRFSEGVLCFKLADNFETTGWMLIYCVKIMFKKWETEQIISEKEQIEEEKFSFNADFPQVAKDSFMIIWPD